MRDYLKEFDQALEAQDLKTMKALFDDCAAMCGFYREDDDQARRTGERAATARNGGESPVRRGFDALSRELRKGQNK
jgi:hypothetical protein